MNTAIFVAVMIFGQCHASVVTVRDHMGKLATVYIDKAMVFPGANPIITDCEGRFLLNGNQLQVGPLR
jgi:hypothetical protein